MKNAGDMLRGFVAFLFFAGIIAALNTFFFWIFSDYFHFHGILACFVASFLGFGLFLLFEVLFEWLDSEALEERNLGPPE